MNKQRIQPTLVLLVATATLGACVSESCPQGEVQHGDKCLPADAGVSSDAGVKNELGVDASAEGARSGAKPPSNRMDGSLARPDASNGDDDAGVDDVVDHDAAVDAAQSSEHVDAGSDAMTIADVDAGLCDGGSYVRCWMDSDEDGYIGPLVRERIVCGTACPASHVEGPSDIARDDCDPRNDAVHPGADESCNGVDDDCDGDTDEGTDSMCAFENGSGVCIGGECELAGCNAGFDDCDGYEDTGCEQALDVDGHCGACNVTCTYDHGSGACVDSACQLAGCDDGYDDCDGYEQTGCEQPLNINGDCGACGTLCHDLAICDASEAVGSCACAPPSFGDGFDCAGVGPLASGTNPIACGIHDDGSAECWYVSGDVPAPSGPFAQLAVGLNHVCGLKTNGNIDCWGSNAYGEGDDHTGSFEQVVAGELHTCALASDRKAVCWGASGSDKDYGQQDAPGTDFFVQLAAGAYHTCGLHSDGTVACWGAGKSVMTDCDMNDMCGQSIPPNGAGDRFVQITAGRWHTCGLRSDGSVTCWGAASAASSVGQTVPPGGVSFRFISAYALSTCGVTTTSGIACWGGMSAYAAPGGNAWERVYTGWLHACALDMSGDATCWGTTLASQPAPDIGGPWPLMP